MTTHFLFVHTCVDECMHVFIACLSNIRIYLIHLMCFIFKSSMSSILPTTARILSIFFPSNGSFPSIVSSRSYLFYVQFFSYYPFHLPAKVHPSDYLTCTK